MQKVRVIFKKILFFSGILVAFFLFVSLGFILVFTHSKSKSNSNKIVLLKNTFSDVSNSINTVAFFNSIENETWLYHVPVDQRIDEEITNQSASRIFGLLVSKTITFPQPQNVTASNSERSERFTKNQLQENLRTAVFSTNPIQSNFWEYWWWWWHIRSRSSSQLKIRTFNSLESWKQYAPERDFQVSTQPCSIAVVNTTGVTGLASEAGAILERSGLFVARLTNNQSNTTNSLILTKNLEECQEVIDAVSILTPNSTEVAIDEAAATRYRARVVILLGRDFTPATDHQDDEKRGEID
jgi:hypothetical protein